MSSVECTVRAVDALVDAVAGRIASAAAIVHTPEDVLTLATAFARFAEGYAFVAGVQAVAVTPEQLAEMQAGVMSAAEVRAADARG